MNHLTSRHDSLQVNDIRMIELSHDAGLAQEVPPLLLCVSNFQRLDGDRHVPLPGQLEPAAAHLPKLSYGGAKPFMSERGKKIKRFTMANVFVYFETKQLCSGGIQIAVQHLVIHRGV